jgi:nitrogen-specific signal transduction histidine kinase
MDAKEIQEAVRICHKSLLKGTDKPPQQFFDLISNALVNQQRIADALSEISLNTRPRP